MLGFLKWQQLRVCIVFLFFFFLGGRGSVVKTIVQAIQGASLIQRCTVVAFYFRKYTVQLMSVNIF